MYIQNTHREHKNLLFFGLCFQIPKDAYRIRRREHRWWEGHVNEEGRDTEEIKRWQEGGMARASVILGCEVFVFESRMTHGEKGYMCFKTDSGRIWMALCRRQMDNLISINSSFKYIPPSDVLEIIMKFASSHQSRKGVEIWKCGYLIFEENCSVILESTKILCQKVAFCWVSWTL